MSGGNLDLLQPSLGLTVSGGTWTYAQLSAYTTNYPSIVATWPIGYRAYTTDQGLYIWNGSSWISGSSGALFTAAAQSAATQGLTLYATGDSQIAGGWSVSTPIANVLSGNGLTGTITGSNVTADCTAGNTIWIQGLVQPEWNGVKTILTNNGTTATFTNATALTPSPSIITTQTNVNIVDEVAYTNRNWLSIANGLCGQPFGSIVCKAGTGEVTGSMLSQFQTDVLAYSPNYVYVHGGVNDVRYASASVYSETAIFANLQSICTQALAAGIRVILSTLPPLTAAGGTGAPANVSGGLTGLQQQQTLLRLNQLIRRYAAVTPGVILQDTAAAVCNPAPSSPATSPYEWTAGGSLWSVDGVHPTSYSAYKIAVQMSSAMQKAGLNRPVSLVSNSNDTQYIIGTGVVDSSQRQLLPNPLFELQTTAAGSSTGITGAGGTGNPTYATHLVPVGNVGTWTTGNSAVSVTCAARADGLGYNQVYTIGQTSNNDQLQAIMQNTGYMNTQMNTFAGHTVKFSMDFSMTSVPQATLAGITVYLNDSTAGLALLYATAKNTVPMIDTNGAATTLDWTIESAPWLIPNYNFGGGSHSCQLIVNFTFQGNAAGAIFTFGRHQLEVLN